MATLPVPEPMTVNAVSDLRARILRGEDIPAEKIREAIDFIRRERTAQPGKTTKGKKSAEPVNLDALFADIPGLE